VIVLRIGGVLVLLTVAVMMGMWMFTRDRRYLRWASLVVRLAIIAAAVFFGLAALERLAMLI
jgi:hypothetical protein